MNKAVSSFIIHNSSFIIFPVVALNHSAKLALVFLATFLYPVTILNPNPKGFSLTL
jgi:hypothetical protein